MKVLKFNALVMNIINLLFPDQTKLYSQDILIVTKHQEDLLQFARYHLISHAVDSVKK